jgi:hypothetical protein
LPSGGRPESRGAGPGQRRRLGEGMIDGRGQPVYLTGGGAGTLTTSQTEKHGMGQSVAAWGHSFPGLARHAGPSV